MSANGRGFMEWKEEFISQERGKRIVHYLLKDCIGDFVLAVVGTERSIRHMIYVVSDEFLRFCGLEKSNNACFKWRSRREVVDWLTSLLSKQQSSQDHPKSPAYDSEKNASVELSVTQVDVRGGYLNCHKGHFANNLKGHSWDIVWSGAAWMCGKQLKHYQAFCRNGTTISIHSFVLVMAKEENHYLAYLEDMYEDRKGQKKVKVRWFHRSQEVNGKIPPPIPHPREIFITPYAQVISAECVDGLATVLTPEHYEKCMSSLPYTSDRIHLCFRQLRNNRIRPFNLRKLHGYFKQTILSSLDLLAATKNELEEEELRNGHYGRRGKKRTRSCRGRERLIPAYSGIGISIHYSQVADCRPAYRILRVSSPGRRPRVVKHVRLRNCLPLSYKIGDKIETLCQDSGIRGCWFRCTVLRISRNHLKVRYEDVQNEDGCGNLEEWIPASRPAAPDKLRMRCSGRLTVRPYPSNEMLAYGVLGIGTPVDAWWNDGWWEGVLTGVDSGGDGLQVYFPGEDAFSIAQRKNLRISRDWIGNRWVDIGVKQDILSVISAVSPSTKVSACKVAESGVSAISERDVVTHSERDSVEDKQAFAGFDAANGLIENSKWVHSQNCQWNEDEVALDDDADDENGLGDSIHVQDGDDRGGDVDGKLL